MREIRVFHDWSMHFRHEGVQYAFFHNRTGFKVLKKIYYDGRNMYVPVVKARKKLETINKYMNVLGVNFVLGDVNG